MIEEILNELIQNTSELCRHRILIAHALYPFSLELIQGLAYSLETSESEAMSFLIRYLRISQKATSSSNIVFENKVYTEAQFTCVDLLEEDDYVEYIIDKIEAPLKGRNCLPVRKSKISVQFALVQNGSIHLVTEPTNYIVYRRKPLLEAKSTAAHPSKYLINPDVVSI